MNKFRSIIKTVAHGIVKAAQEVAKLGKVAQLAEPEIAAIGGVLAPKAAKYEGLAFDALAHMVEAAATVSTSNPTTYLSIAVDAALIEEFKAIASDVKAIWEKAHGVSPAQPVAPQPPEKK